METLPSSGESHMADVPSTKWPMKHDGIRASDIRHTSGCSPSDDVIAESRFLLREIYVYIRN